MPTINLTDKNMGLLKAVVEVMKADINWDEVAKKADMKTSKYARDQWTIVRNKLVAGGGEGGTKESGGKKRKDSATETPTPTPKKAKTGNGKKVDEAAEGTEVKDEEEDEF